MPIFLDQSLRKAILSKIRESFGRDEILSGKVKVLDQETFLPESENQVILTDINVANESLDASNRVTELEGTVTFAPLKRPDYSFLFWAQENPREAQLVSQGFYHLTLNRTAQQQSGDVPDQGWTITAQVIKRLTQSRRPWLGLKIFLEKLFETSKTLNVNKLVVKQEFQVLQFNVDYFLVDLELILKRYTPNTEVWYDGVDVTDSCFYADLVSDSYTLSKINRPIQLRPTVLLGTITVYNMTLERPLASGRVINNHGPAVDVVHEIDPTYTYRGYVVQQNGLLTWLTPVEDGTEVLVQYYEKKPLRFWDIPAELSIKLEAEPLIYGSGEPAIEVVSNFRGLIKAPICELVGSTLRIIEPIPQESIKIDYRYHLTTLGPVPVSPASIDDQIFPGISLTFTDNFIDGDEAVVIKHDQKKAIGQENGGNNKVEISLKLRSADDKMLERMTSRVFFLFTDLTSLMELSNQGVSMENSVSYARSYEERDGNSEKWLVNTFRLVVHHTWRYLIPYVTDLNSVGVTIGTIQDTKDTGAPTLQDLIFSTSETNWVQPY